MKVVDSTCKSTTQINPMLFFFLYENAYKNKMYYDNRMQVCSNNHIIYVNKFTPEEKIVYTLEW